MNTDFLKDIDEAWQGIQAKDSNSYSEVPEGDYQCKVESAQIKEGKQGQPVLHWGLRIISGQYAKRMVFKPQRFVPESLPFLKADLELLGICPEKISDLETVLPFALDAVVDIRIKNTTRKDGSPFQSVYFNRLVKPGQRTAQAAVPEGFTMIAEDTLPWEEEETP